MPKLREVEIVAHASAMRGYSITYFDDPRPTALAAEIIDCVFSYLFGFQTYWMRGRQPR